jgi:hypothetical protein
MSLVSMFQRKSLYVVSLMVMLATLGTPARLFGQADQAAIAGEVTDPSGAVVSNATVTLTSADTNLTLKRKVNGAGSYSFSPIKIGNYRLLVEAKGFQTIQQDNIHLDLQQRLTLNWALKPAGVVETVEVSTEPPALQTDDASTGQVVSAQTINDTPLNGRNYVFIAQLTAGVVASNGSRGQGGGDFNANGQRAEQNNFILDGVDNNSNAVDFLNGASFVVRPPPDALAEFKVQTGSYDAELGHSAGAVINASIKSGTNKIHGNLWEYFRNNILDTRDFTATTIPEYRQNQFGGTLGFPIIKDKLFLFIDTEVNRIVFAQPNTGVSVPTALERAGDFSELLNPSLTGASQPIKLYQPGSANPATPLSCNGRVNVLCPQQIDKVAQSILKLYPLPNANNGLLYNNYVFQSKVKNNVFQFDVRSDWNITPKDQAYARFSYSNNLGYYPPPLGPILDGGGYGNDGDIKALGENFMASETHAFSDSLINEFRFGYNYGHFSDTQPNANVNSAAQVGLGGIPTAPLNGGLPATSIGGLSSFGATAFYAANEYENVFQILDNVTKTQGQHTLKGGVSIQHIRFYTLAPTFPRGSYAFDGKYTSIPGVSNTGSGIADFLTNSQDYAQLSNFSGADQVRFQNGFYAEDSWRATKNLTINYGVRYEFAQPYFERHDRQASFYPTGPLNPGSSAGTFVLPKSQTGFALPQSFLNTLAKDNVSVSYDSNRQLVQGQKTNFAPRLGIAERLSNRAVIRAGYGIFFGGVENIGGSPNLGFNFPFQFTSAFNSPNCLLNNCPTDGITLEDGFTKQIAAGLINSASNVTVVGSQRKAKTSYSEQFNLALEISLSNNLTASAAYVGSVSHHLLVAPDVNAPAALIAPGLQANAYRPFPDLGTLYFNEYSADSNYNSLQTKIERRFSHGLSFLGTYTYSHSLDDATTPLGSAGDGGYRNVNLIGLGGDYSNSPWDTRHRLTLNGTYELPFGKGKKFFSDPSLLNYVVGGWSGALVFRAQTGQPFTVYNSTAAANGAGSHPYLIRDPFKGGGSPDPSNPGTVCPTRVKTLEHWYNPCAFANPLPASSIAPGQVITGSAARAYLGGPRNTIYGPGYERIDMALFKAFPTFREQFFQLRVDAFDVLNTPAYGQPNGSIGSSGGQIVGTRYFSPNTPTSRFFQLALKYYF